MRMNYDCWIWLWSGSDPSVESGKVTGIVNRIDADLYNPVKRIHSWLITSSLSDLSGKQLAKQALQERVGLPVRDDVPLFGIVSFDTSKSFDVVVEGASTFARDHSIVLLSTGDPGFENAFA